MKTLSVVCVSLLLFGVARAPAQASKRGSVSVSCSCDDTTGKAYASALHEALAKSPHYREVKADEGVGTDSIQIRIVSLPLDGDAAGKSKHTAISIVCMYKGALVQQFIETCNAVTIAACAEETLAQFDFLTS